MFDFIPIENYIEIYTNIILLICVFTAFHTIALQNDDVKIFTFNRWAGLFLITFLLIFIGLRPINGVFVDMMTYSQTFQQFQMGVMQPGNGDLGFEYFMFFCTKIMTVEGFFFTCAVIYLVPLFIACKNWFPNYYFFGFLVIVASFSFWTYGTNGIRNGMATSLFILGLSYFKKNHILMALFLILAVTFHKSMLLPLFALGITYVITDTKKYYFFWLFSILLSITMGGIWIGLFTSLGFGDERLTGYLSTQADPSQFSSTGFRYDFLLYSAAPLVLAYKYIFKYGFTDKIYKHILHTYIIVNGFWIMIIRANFSNRFAYLSWFLMALVVIYPLLKQEIWEQQFRKIGIVILLYYGFTYFMFYYYQYR